MQAHRGPVRTRACQPGGITQQWRCEKRAARLRRRNSRPVSARPATGSRAPSWTTARPPSPSSPSASASPRPPSAGIWTRWSPTTSSRPASSGSTARAPVAARQGLRAHRLRPGRLRPVLRRARRGRPALDRASAAAAEGEAAVAAFARARIAAQAEALPRGGRGRRPEERTEALAKALSADGYAATARSAPIRSRASSSASTTARSPMSPSSSRSCARRRPRSSPAARDACAAAGHHRPRRRGVHDVHPARARSTARPPTITASASTAGRNPA